MNDSQEGAQTPEARIAAVLMEHGRRIDPNHPGYGNCRCGFVVDLPQDQAGHVAAVLTAALGLTPEHRINVMSSSGMTTNTITGKTTYHSDMRYDQRFVTNWERA